jgi:endogenous inhibitor of DNA gyrase (YacG/DUF329 family)
MPDRSFADERVPSYMISTQADTALHEASKTHDPPPTDAKAVLFCPECGHEGHVTAEWTTRDDYVGGTRAVVCPECGTTVTERPLPTRSANAVGGESRWAGTETRLFWEPWRDLWRSSFELVTNWPRESWPPGSLSTR